MTIAPKNKDSSPLTKTNDSFIHYSTYTFLILSVQKDSIPTKAVQLWASKFPFLGPVSSSEKWKKIDFPKHRFSNQIF